jgi:Mg2+/Co2+ transporter CorB
MRRDDNPCISLVEHLPSEPSRLTVNILIGNELLNVAAPIIDASLAIRLIGVKNQLRGQTALACSIAFGWHSY